MAQDDKPSTLTIRILGRDYPVACPQNEREALLTSAEYLAKRMQAIQKKGKTLGVDRIAVMAALNTARELLSLQQDIEQLRGQLGDGGRTAQMPAAAHQTQHDELDQRLAQLQLRIETALDDPA